MRHCHQRQAPCLRIYRDLAAVVSGADDKRSAMPRKLGGDMDAELLRFMVNQRARVSEQLRALSERAKKRRDTQFELTIRSAQGTKKFEDVEYPRDLTKEQL